MVEYLAGNRIIGNTAERPNAGVGGWVELARNTLGSAGDLLDSGTFTAKQYLCVQVYTKNSGTINHAIKFNGDGNANYSFRRNLDGGTDGSDINTSNDPTISMSSLGGFPLYATIFIANNTSKEKLTIAHTGMQNTAGDYAPKRRKGVAKWANTSAQITQVTVSNSDGGSYDTGSEIVVLGWDPADTHITNFWEELASVELTSAGDTLDSGTFTAKKYLWVQSFTKGTGGATRSSYTMNSDTGHYSYRYSVDDGGDATGAGQQNLYFNSNTTGNTFTNSYIINNSANEKIVISDVSKATSTGASSATVREENVGKWSNTSSQITSIQMLNSGAGSFDTGSIIKVWGSD